MKPRSILPKSGVVLHVSGIPATGKSSLCKYLAREHGFAHYDLERFPLGWPIPDPDLERLWRLAPAKFVLKLKELHGNTAINWGFPVDCINMVHEFRNAGARLIWFQGNTTHARRLFVERGDIDPRAFDRQVASIAKSHLPTGLEATVVDTLTPEGLVRPMEAIYEQVFGAR